MTAIKKIHAFMAVVALSTITASAQSEVVMSEAEMAAAIMADTTKVFVQTFKNPNTSIATEASVVAGQAVAAGDTIYFVGYKYYYAGGLKKAPAYVISRVKTTVTEKVRDEAQWNSLKKASVESRFAEAMASSSGRKRDTRWYEATSGEDTLRIVRHGNDKNHWFIAARGTYQISDGANGFGGGLEVQYLSDSFWWGSVGASITKNEMYALAENAGEGYTSYSGYALAGGKLSLGRRENFIMSLGAGLKWTWQQTNTRQFTDEYGNEYMMKSTHSTVTPVIRAEARYRFPDTRFAVFGGGEWSIKDYTYQNASSEKHSAWDVYVGVAVGLHGNYVRTK